MSTASAIAGRIYPAKSGRLELIDILKEQMHAAYQPVDRASITRPVLSRVIADLEHAVLLLDALQDEREEAERFRAACRKMVDAVEDGDEMAAVEMARAALTRAEGRA